MADKPARTPRTPRTPRVVIDIDADPHNANWLRILEQRRQQRQGQQQPKKRPPVAKKP